MCFIVAPNGDIACAKRTAILEEAEAGSFFGANEVRHRLRPQLHTLRALALESLPTADPNTASLAVYGEIFGGHYPHDDVPATPSVGPVQTGVWYCPGIEFSVFDVALGPGEDRAYFNIPDVIRMCEAAGILCTQVLFTGSLQACLDYSPKFQTAMPGRLGLPALENNFAEGVVIRPTEEFIVTTPKGMRRPLVKNKIVEFAENLEYHGAVKPDAAVGGGALQELEWEVVARVNDSRVAAAISKLGPVAMDNREQMRALLAVVVRDVVDQLEEDGVGGLEQLGEMERAQLMQLTETECKKVIVPYLRKRRALAATTTPS
mmetsp:Transcript_60401/g.131138  ORF Transcript_60401/g.131138 Transcript_60401/m.131138 type:complete len:319 (+) Transcript_60401:59-1015(+)